jgi:hypothetical protein
MPPRESTRDIGGIGKSHSHGTISQLCVQVVDATVDGG